MIELTTKVRKSMITTSWDDGGPLDLKLAELLSRYDIPATFYIPIIREGGKYSDPQLIREISQSFGIGAHGYHHMDLTRISPNKAEQEIIQSKQRLEEIIGEEVVSFCYPRGRFDSRIANIVKGTGFIGARTTKLLTKNIKDPFRMGTMVFANKSHFATYIKHTAISLDPSIFLLMLRKNLFLKSWDLIAIETLNFVIKNGGVWHLWGHSWEIDNNNDWERLENVFRQINTLAGKTLKVNNSQLMKMYAKNKRARLD